MPTASPSLDSTTLTLAVGWECLGCGILSPGGAWHLRQFLDERKPTVVLIEGLSDAEELIPDIVRRDSEPPLAILATPISLPVRTLVYPLAQYSPSIRLSSGASEHKARAEFIDLPSNIFLACRIWNTKLPSGGTRSPGRSERRRDRRRFYGGTGIS